MEAIKKQHARFSPVLVKIKERRDLCTLCPEKKTYHIALDLAGSGLTYKVGDCVGVCPINDQALVSKTVEALRATGTEEVADKKTEEKHLLANFLRVGANLTDINRKFLKDVALKQTDICKKERMESLLQPEGKEKLKDYLSGRHYWDVLHENPEVRFSSQEFCDYLMPLLPRYYSIASSPSVTPDEIHLTVKALSYEAHGHPRKGVCTNFLCHMAPAEEPAVFLFIHPHKGFTVPEDPAAPMIMVGPGTGVAPFRAFMQERIASGASGKHWLFFGEWKRSNNFLYGDYWMELENKGHLQLTTAFSRDQQEKVYVQHRLLEQGSEIYRWLEEGAYFYVCGDAQSMAKDVEAALIEIIKKHGGRSDEEGKEYVKKLRKDKRYLRDVY